MGAFSLKRAAEYARYNYTVQAKNYLLNVLSMVAIPILFGVLSRSVATVSGLSLFVYGTAAIVFPVREVWLMRERSERILAMTLPVSSAERWVTMVFNLAVLLPVVAIVSSVVATVVVYPFDYKASQMPLNVFVTANLEEYLDWMQYVCIQLFASVSLLIALMARRRLVLAYVLAVVAVIIFVFGVVDVVVEQEWYVNIEANIEAVELAGKILYCLLPVVFYVLSYVALKRRQVKW
jgi:hypothetical protein